MNRYLIILMISFISVIPNLSMAFADSELKNVPITRLLEKIPATAFTIETTFDFSIRDYPLCDDDGFGRRVILTPYAMYGGGHPNETYVLYKLTFFSKENKVIDEFKLLPNFNYFNVDHKTYYISNEVMLNITPSMDTVKTKFQLGSVKRIV